MVLTNIIGCIKKGTLAELPAHGTYLTDYLYYCTNTSDLYWDNGTAWVLLQGAAKSEILQNKTIAGANNNLTGLILDPFVSQKRQGFITPSLSAAGSLKYALKGLPNIGDYSLPYIDTTEKYVSRFTASTAIQVGYQSNATTKFTTKRSLNPSLKVRCRSTNANNTFMFIGFSTKLPTPNGGTPIDNTSSGVIIGMTNTDANYFTKHNDGSGSPDQNNTSIPRDSIFRTFEITMSASNIVTKINDVVQSTLTTNLLGLETELYLLIELHNITGTNNFDIAKGSFSSD